MPRHGNLGQCSLSLCPWALHCGSPELYSVEGSPRISCAACRHMNLKYILYYTILPLQQLCGLMVKCLPAVQVSQVQSPFVEQFICVLIFMIIETDFCLVSVCKVEQQKVIDKHNNSILLEVTYSHRVFIPKVVGPSNH